MLRNATAGRASGQTVYQVLLIVAAFAVALAAFFPLYEYVTLYRGDIQTRKDSPERSPMPPPAPKIDVSALQAAPAAAAATTTTTAAAPSAPETSAATTTTLAPAASGEAPKPAE